MISWFRSFLLLALITVPNLNPLLAAANGDTVTVPYAINDLGQIAAVAHDPFGSTRAVSLTTSSIPEPAATAAFCSALAFGCAIFFRRRLPS
jgi:hypothetical protein